MGAPEGEPGCLGLNSMLNAPLFLPPPTSLRPRNRKDEMNLPLNTMIYENISASFSGKKSINKERRYPPVNAPAK